MATARVDADAAPAARPAGAAPPADNVERGREVARLFRIHRTVCEMLADRGYDVRPAVAAAAGADKAWLMNSNIDQFRERVLNGDQPLKRSQLSFVCSSMPVAGHDRKSVLVWYEGGDLKTDVVKAIIGHAETYETQSVIVVCAAKIQPIARTYVETSNREATSPHVELFAEDHLVVNITKHELVPTHEPLTAEQTKEVLAAFALNISMLPRILASDPVALYFGLKRGQVVRITRKSETAGHYVTFRQVV